MTNESLWASNANHDFNCMEMTSEVVRPHSVSITEFGAVGDGVTLNTLAFQNAIFYLHSFADKGGAQLFVPGGSKAENVTTNSQSQGIRFLSHLTGTTAASKACAKPIQARNNAGVRLSSTTEVASNIARESKASGINRPSIATKVASNIARENKVSRTKRKNNETSVNMIELDIVSSDEKFM
ncbi:uncharacterized protein A4U43_C01F7520 [Asparagus officinalis]|uniref:Uncharacterized protein n=1 Tax=Asparagus officinalis TaxID=4686 RepID=A0A5P1FSB5_ASPOF|nr:uncharacterized protein A4U43_C01F7520 [Asparagus officinalis]